MRFVSINKLMNEIKTLFPTVQSIQMLLNVEQFHEDKFKNTQGPILLMKIIRKDSEPISLTFTQLIEKFGEELIVKLIFPQDNKENYLICTINAEQKTSQLGPYYERSYSKVGYKTTKKAQELTAEYEKTQVMIGDAIEM